MNRANGIMTSSRAVCARLSTVLGIVAFNASLHGTETTVVVAFRAEQVVLRVEEMQDGGG